MSESDSVKKLIMDSASQIALDGHLDGVHFDMRPPEFLYEDYMSVTFYKEKRAVNNLFPINEFLKMESDFRPFAINTYLTTMANKL